MKIQFVWCLLTRSFVSVRELSSLKLQLEQSKEENRRLKARIADIDVISGASVGEQARSLVFQLWVLGCTATVMSATGLCLQCKTVCKKVFHATHEGL